MKTPEGAPGSTRPPGVPAWTARWDAWKHAHAHVTHYTDTGLDEGAGGFSRDSCLTHDGHEHVRCGRPRRWGSPLLPGARRVPAVPPSESRGTQRSLKPGCRRPGVKPSKRQGPGGGEARGRGRQRGAPGTGTGTEHALPAGGRAEAGAPGKRRRAGRLGRAGATGKQAHTHTPRPHVVCRTHKRTPTEPATREEGRGTVQRKGQRNGPSATLCPFLRSHCPLVDGPRNATKHAFP